jgi:hydroxymethylglutaryl-CoA lyase
MRYHSSLITVINKNKHILFRHSTKKTESGRASRSVSSGLTDKVQIVEVGPRDGLQNEKSCLVSVADKVQLVIKLADAGCSYIEVGSFVSAKAVPAMANSYEVMKELNSWKEQRKLLEKDEVSSLKFACLVPTMKYFQSAIEVQTDEISIFTSASETFCQKVSILFFSTRRSGVAD